ncbi:MAG: hypothetical protein IPL52_05710 [Flavobacteriales bacterium]|nr:hypothetical protein [Flavobacteriales bacterium]
MSRILLLPALLCAVQALAQSYPMTVTTTVPLPPPITWAELQDQAAAATVTVNSMASGAVSVTPFVVLRCQERGIRISSVPSFSPGQCIDIDPGTTVYNVDELTQQFDGGFGEGDFQFAGITFAQIRDQQLLPEGYWEICVQLLACPDGDAMSAPIPAGCSGWLVVHPQPPVFTNICNTTFTLPDGLLNIAWTFSPPPALFDQVSYRLDIVRIDPPGDRVGDANDAMLSATEPELFSMISEEMVMNLEIPDQLTLDAGYHYAVRVTAVLNGGLHDESVLSRSEVCSFLYAPEGLSGNGMLRALWPANDDWVPFDFVNVVAMFDPYRDYTRFTYTTTMRAIGGAAFPDYTRTLNWPDGPEGTQELVTFSGLSIFEAQCLSVFHPNSGLPFDAYRRGQRYQWRTAGDFTMGGTTYHGDSGEEPFGIGMGPSQPQEPADATIVPTGNVTLRWLTANTPNEPLPPFSVVQAVGSSGPIFIDGNVNEHWQLEVSRRSDFSTIFHSTHGSLTGESWTLNSAVQSESAYLADIYKELENTASYTEEGTYYWRLHWKTDPSSITSANYNTSEVFTFCVGHCDDAPTTEEVVPPAEGGPCVSVCLEPAPTNTAAVSGAEVGSTVRVGKFNMEVITREGSGTTYTGTGKIEVPFLNNTKIMVAFTGLRVNSDGRMVAGDVVARKDWNPPTLNTITGAVHNIPTMSEGDVDAMEGFIQDGARLVSLLMGGQEIGLPIGIEEEVDGRLIVCGIINMKFGAERAYLDMVAGVDVMEIHTKLVFGVGDLCMTPNGLGDEGRAYLPYDILVTGDLDTRFKFKGGASTDLTNLTYVDWDCEGFKCVQIAAAVEFDRGTVLPAGDHDPAGTERVEANMKFSVCRSLDGTGAERHETWNVMARFTMDPFEVPGADGFTFTVEEAWLDWSTIANPDGMRFPEGYVHAAMGAEETQVLWKGFYMKRLAMTTPEVWGDGTGGPVGGSVNHFIVDDENTLSFNVAMVNLLAFNQGRIDSWAFSVDSLYMDMLQNTFQRAGLAGRIGLPINGEHDNLGYRAILGFDDTVDEFLFTLNVELEDTLTAPLWIAEMELLPNSFVQPTLPNPSNVHAELNGSISISTALASELGIDLGSIPSIQMPGMNFEGLVLDSDEGLSCRNCAFAYASPDKEVGGFPLSIRNLSLEFDDPTHPALVVEPMVSLSGGEGESSFAASVALKFVTVLEINGSGVQRFDFQDVQFTGMHLDVDVSAMRLVGDLRITKTATKEEVKGALTVGFPMGIRGDLQAIFGTIKTDPAVPINTSAQHYQYWMVDGMLYFNPGLMIMTGVGIYGFGGGAYHHMRFIDGSLPTNTVMASMAPQTPPNEIAPADANAGNDHPDDFTSGLTADASAVGSGPAPSGGRYEEDFNTFLGIRLALVFGTYPNPKGCNMDLTLRGEFTSTGGLSLLQVRGDIYGLVDIPERNEARITGNILFSYANREGNEVIHANLSVMLDFVVARGAGAGNKLVDANFHTESATGKWYFIMGTPDNPGGIVVGPPGGAPILRITNYIMVGNDSIPFELPDPPARIMEILGLNNPSRGLGTEAETAAAIGGDRDMGPLENGAGFAFGAGFELNLDLNLAVLYANIGMALGFDLLLSEIPESMVCAETGTRPGDNGWYAQGQMYAGIWGELGVQLDLLFVRFRAPILSMSAAMLLQGNFPNPSGFRGHAAVHFSVLNGAITADATLTVEDGQQCTLMPAGDPLADFQFIKDLGPKGWAVSIFDLPTASYNLPVQEVLEVPKLIDPNTHAVVMYRFHPYVSSFTLKELVGNVNIPGTNQFGDERGTSSFLTRINAMKPLTIHQTRVEVRVREETSPGHLIEFVNPETHAVWSESRTQNFRTGVAPDHITEDQVDYTYPVNRQRYFLQHESNNKGRVRQSMGAARPDLFQATIDGRGYSYVAKFIPLGGGATQETTITYTGGLDIPLTVPNLDHERIYVVQLIRRLTSTAGGLPVLNVNIPGGIGGPAATAAVTAAQISAPLSLTFIAANGDVQNQRLTGGNVQRAVSMLPNDHLLYTFRFRSSKYNTLQEKFASLTLEGKTPARYDHWRNADVRGNATETFDDIDIQGYWKNGARKLAPLVWFAPNYGDSYFQYLQNTSHVLYNQYRNTRTYTFPGNSVSLPAFPVVHPLLWGNSHPQEPIVSYNGYIEAPISDDEMEDAAAPPSSVPMLNLGLGATQGIGNTAPGAGVLGSMGASGGFGITGLLGNSGLLSNAAPWPGFGFLYRAGKHAVTDQMTIRVATFTALNAPGANGSYLTTLLQQHGPSLNRANMLYIIMRSDDAVGLRHTGNLPTVSPSDEFPIFYNANYHVQMRFRSPIPGSRNTVSEKQFTLIHEEPPAYNGSTVLY